MQVHMSVQAPKTTTGSKLIFVYDNALMSVNVTEFYPQNSSKDENHKNQSG